MPRSKDRKPASPRPPADIFAPTRLPASTKRGPGRPPVHDEDWTKVTVVLFNRQIVFLDRVATSIRDTTGAAISRAQLIRALVDAVAEAGVDLTSSRSEADMKLALLGRLDGTHGTPDTPGKRRSSQDL